MICHQCGEVGHWRRNCPVYLAELMKKKKLSQGASTSGIFTLELYSFPSTTGCGTHIFITTQGLRRSRKLKPKAFSLYVGDGHRSAVEAIREFHLCLPSGLVLILHNCHYAPSITRDIISVSRFYKDGFVNRFKNDNSILVSRNNLVYFCAITRDDIYEIDLSSSNTNDSSITVSRQGASYFVTLIDDFSRYGYVYLLKHKHEVFETFKVFQKEVENQLGKTIKLLDSDHREASESLEDLEIIQEEDTHPSLDTSLHHEEDDQEIDKPQSDINPIRRSTRTRRATDRLCLYVDAEEHELGDLGEPTNYKATLLDPKSDKWLNAMNVEMQSMRDNEV
ncbi:retrotransposon protein, putative, ty1-copia subclass [Tanacetum coccineum]